MNNIGHFIPNIRKSKGTTVLQQVQRKCVTRIAALWECSKIVFNCRLLWQQH